MDIVSRNINVSGVLDYNTDYENFKEGNLSDSINTRVQNDMYQSLVGRGLVKGNRFVIYPESVSVCNKRFRVTFDTEDYYNNNYTVKIYSPNGIPLHSMTHSHTFGASLATVLSDFQTDIISDFGSAVTINGVATLTATTGYVDFEIITIPYWDYEISFKRGGYLKDAKACILPIDPSMLGQWIPVAGADLLGDYFILWTTKKDLPITANIVRGLDDGTGKYVITTDIQVPYTAGGVVSINGTVVNDGQWMVNQLTLATFEVIGSTYTTDISGGTITFYPNSISEIGVGTHNINSDTWTYTRLARTTKLNIRAVKQPEIGVVENNIFRKSLYWCDHYNPDRVFYYSGEYIKDGAYKSNNSNGIYDIDSIETNTRLISGSGDASIGFVSQSLNGGVLLSGTYRYTGRFLSDEKTPTGYYLEPTLQMPVFSYSSSNALGFTGDKEATPTNKANVLFVTHPANTFKYFELISIYYTGGTISGEIVSRTPISDGATETIITHRGNEPSTQTFDVGLILSNNTIWDISKTMRVINNRMTRSNLYSSASKYDLSEWFKTFKHKVKAKKIPSVGFPSPTSSNTYSINEYEIPDNVEGLGGFMFHECYRMMGKVQWKDGSYSDSFWIDDILIDLNDYNIHPSYPDNRRIGNDYSATGLGLGFRLNGNPTLHGELTTYIPYLDFSGYDMNYVINGKSIKNLISRIIIERCDVVREVLGSGMLAMGVGNLLPLDPDSVSTLYYLPNDYDPSITYYGANPFITGLDNFWDITQIANPKYSEITSMTPNPKTGFFFCLDWITKNEFPSPVGTDKIICYGNPCGAQPSFGGIFTQISNPAYYHPSPSYSQWTGYTGVLSPVIANIVEGGLIESKLDSYYTVIGGTKRLIGELRYRDDIYFIRRYLWQPHLGLLFDADLNNNSSFDDYGFYMAYYYRGISVYDEKYNPDSSKYGQIASSKATYLCGTIITKDIEGVVAPETTVGIFGFDVFTQGTPLKIRHQYYPEDSKLVKHAQFSGLTFFYSQNVCNTQLIVKDDNDNTTWNYPANAWETVMRSLDYFIKPTYDIANNYQHKPNTDVVFNSEDVVRALPATIFYSDIKPLNSYIDTYRIWLPLNFADLDLKNGEIVTHEIINRQLFCLQPRTFERREFNSSGRLITSDSSQVVLGDGSVIAGLGTEISNIGCTNKFSAVKGRSRGGNDVLYWWNTELKTIVRFGADGTVPLSFIRSLEPFVRSNVKWVTGKDAPASGQGIMGVWNDINKEVIWSVNGMVETTYRNKWTETNTYNVADMVFFETAYYICIKFNKGASPQESIDYWMPIYEEDGVTYTQAFKDRFMTSYTLVYSEFQTGASGRRSFMPYFMGKWKDTYLTADNLTGKVYEHEVDTVPLAQFYEVQHDGYDEFVVSAQQATVEDYGAIRFNTELEPYKVEFQTNNNESSLSRGEFSLREKWYDSPIKYTTFAPPQTFGSKLYGNYIKVKLHYLKSEIQTIKGFVIKSKTRRRKSNT